MSDLKVLFYDLETAPLLAYIWNPWDDYIPHDRLIHDSFLLSWSAQWRGESKVVSGLLTSAEAVVQDDLRIVKDLAALIREADIIVAHNIDKFDLPVFNTRLLAHGLDPIPPVKTIDTLKLAKSSFRLAYRKLDYLADFLFGDKKIKTDFDLWKRCYHGNEAALKQMLKYNRKDVVLLARVFESLLPYVKGVPRLTDPTVRGACPFCGAGPEEQQKRGFHRTGVSTFQRYYCANCGRYHRARKAEPLRPETAPL